MDKNEFVKEYRALVARSLSLVEKATNEGLLSLEEMIDEEKFIQRDIFEYGLRLVVDGLDYEIIERILTNIVGLEPDKDKKLLKTIQKEAVLGICAGTNQRTLLMTLNSFVNIDVEDTMRKYYEIEKLEMENWKSKRLKELQDWKQKNLDKLEDLKILEKMMEKND
jgi:flagellar motor component MotA